MPNIGPAPDRCSISASARPPVIVPDGRFRSVAFISRPPLGRSGTPTPTPTLPRLRGRGLYQPAAPYPPPPQARRRPPPPQAGEGGGGGRRRSRTSKRAAQRG